MCTSVWIIVALLIKNFLQIGFSNQNSRSDELQSNIQIFFPVADSDLRLQRGTVS